MAVIISEVINWRIQQRVSADQSLWKLFSRIVLEQNDSAKGKSLKKERVFINVP